MTAPHDDTATDHQSIIAQQQTTQDAAEAREAALEAEKCALLKQLTASGDAYREHIDHQAATIDVLRRGFLYYPWLHSSAESGISAAHICWFGYGRACWISDF